MERFGDPDNGTWGHGIAAWSHRGQEMLRFTPQALRGFEDLRGSERASRGVQVHPCFCKPRCGPAPCRIPVSEPLRWQPGDCRALCVVPSEYHHAWGWGLMSTAVPRVNLLLLRQRVGSSEVRGTGQVEGLEVGDTLTSVCIDPLAICLPHLASNLQPIVRGARPSPPHLAGGVWTAGGPRVCSPTCTVDLSCGVGDRLCFCALSTCR